MMKILCLGALSAASIFFAQSYPVSAIPEDLKKNAGAVIRKEFQRIEINNIDDIVYKKSSAITILNKDAVPYSIPRIGYSKGANASGIKVVIYDEKGLKVKSYSKSDFVDIAANPQGTFYSDNRMLILPYNYQHFPYTIEFSYELKDENTVFIPDFIPFYEYNVSLQESNLSIINKTPIKLRSKVYDSPYSYASVQVKNESAGSSYSFRNIPAIDKEGLGPSPQRILPKVSFSLDQFNLVGKKGSIISWQDFGKWYYDNLLSPVSVSTPQIKSEIESLHLTGSTEEKVKKVYQYMQSKTRYIFVALGIGGWQPMLPDEVQKKGYGDCKGLTNYMKMLLDEAGIPSYYCIINADASPISFDKEFPKMSGNHVILMVPTEKGNIWLENTSQEMAFNHLGFSTTDRNVLAVKPEGIEIIQTPSYTAEESKGIQTITIQLGTHNSVSGTARFSYQGSQYDYNLVYLMLAEKERKEQLKNKLSSLNIEQLDINKIVNNKDLATIDFDINFKADNYVKMLGSSYIFRAVPIYTDALRIEDENRVLPFEHKLPSQDEYAIDYQLPAGYFIEEVPRDVNLDSEFGTYSLSFSKKEDQLLVKRVLRINKGLYPKEKYNDYVRFRKKIFAADHAKILMSKKI
ncbi:DUF3857 domain-containing protein [Chryseobacterium pennipullorum]|uniref:DUF3857 domain-containing protein n=1 Tax=Chryseobacterium pennipullorum TaxID=2258963 RepID=A0A3D9AYS2_9FLAO|nr:DUF3857 domain-containing protein [Chryseobacterium pennipullorum]REC46495.1 DUF3857 domain-containing protein [Chryseobacterium pennipullorum]